MTLLPAAVVFMIGALTFYTVGVWGERFAGRLRMSHVAFFWLGLSCDTVGTDLMRRLVGGIQMNLHGATGAIALGLMLVHALWAVFVIRGRDERALTTFHRVSVVVWAVWLVPFFSGVIMAGGPRG